MEMMLRWRAIEFRRGDVVAAVKVPAHSTDMRKRKAAPLLDALVQEIRAKGLRAESGFKTVFREMPSDLQGRFASAAAGAKAVRRAFDSIEVTRSAPNIVPIKLRERGEC
jgi:hypothetical protein